MTRTLAVTAVVAVCLSSLMLAAGGEQPPKLELKTPAARLSYAFGMLIGQQLKQMEADIDIATFTRGLEDGLQGREPLLTPEEAMEIQTAFIREKQREQEEKREALGEKNREEGEAFLEGNADKEGVVTTESGLQYVVLREGDGPKPNAADRVTVHYRGTLIDGTEFDSSYERGEPTSFQLNRVIAGWTEGLQLMNAGSKYRLFVPSKLAYGARGAGLDIGPDATLIFEVELLEIQE